MKPFTKINVVGTRFRAQEEQDQLTKWSEFWGGNTSTVKFKPEPENMFDKNAIAVFVAGIHAGYVPAAICIEFGEFLAAHPDLTASADIVMRDGMPVVTVNIDPI